MKNIFFICIAVQIALAAFAAAQITFTREWVTGKRSLPPGRKVILKEEHGWCSRSFIPVIEYLVEEERIRKHECGPHLKITIPKVLPWGRPSHLEEIPRTMTVDKEEDLQYDADILTPKSL